MYQPLHHREDRLDVQHALIRAHPLGTLVTVGTAGLVANHIPFILDPIGPKGLLKGHLARANTQWQAYDRGVEALVIFQGVEHYITPAWYVTKQQTGKVVPTWNYVSVHAYGQMTVIDDARWLAQQIAALTASQEERRAEPWAVTDAPPAFIEAQIKAIIGIKILITRIEGKWKVSQNRPEADRNGVVEGLRQCGDQDSAVMAELVHARGPRQTG
jgi:transcriptional regulator